MKQPSVTPAPAEGDFSSSIFSHASFSYLFSFLDM
jgi:hypothetical protein